MRSPRINPLPLMQVDKYISSVGLVNIQRAISGGAD